jgi:signal transduction histidine kinase
LARALLQPPPAEVLARRVESLSASRAAAVEAADAERRRIERDLHDGAQQQLVSLALDLRMLKARLADSGLAGTVDQIGDKLAMALAELREFARGIHPAFLSERGVGAAVDALVARAPLDVEAKVELPERLPAPVEAAAYFVVAEGLTNVIRYAETRNATVRVSEVGGEVVVVVTDDGKGGAIVEGGTGLRGLIDRLQVLDGRLDVTSPPGGGTTLVAHIPCEPGSQGMCATSVVPAPGGLVTSKRPSSTCSRSMSPRRPVPPSTIAPPLPSSVTRTTTSPPTRLTSTHALRVSA